MSQLPTPPDSNTGSSDADQVRKRAVRQNDQSYSIGIDLDPTSNLMREGFTHEKYRTGCPPLLILPLESNPVPGEERAYSGINELFSRIEQTIDRLGLTLDKTQDMEGRSPNIELVYRTLPFQDPSQEHLTLLIPAQWDEEEPYRWLYVANELRALLVQHPFTRPVRVELIGGHYLHEQRVDDVDADHPIVPIWDTLRPQVRSLLLEAPRLRNRWCSIGVLRMGDYNWAGIGPRLPTILSILVDCDVNPNEWKHTEGRLKDLLSTYSLFDIQIFFDRGEVQSAVFTLRQPTKDHERSDLAGRRDYSEKIKMGADLGPARYFQTPDGKHINGPSATFGGYLKVIDLRTGDVSRMGLTNWHCVREVFPDFRYGYADNKLVKMNPSVGSELYSMDHDGMKPDYPLERRQQLSQVESPSRRKHKISVYGLASQLSELQAEPSDSAATRSVQARYDRTKAFFDQGQQELGTLWAGSGFRKRTPDNGRLDWALINFTQKNRIGTNFIPDEDDWPSLIAPPINGQELNGVGSLEDPRNRGDVYALGARSKFMGGKFKRLKDDIRIPEWDSVYGAPHSTEYCFINRMTDRSFAAPGDSGSMVFNNKGNLVGLIHGGSSSQVHLPGLLVYVTDAEALLQSMNGLYQGQYSFELA